MSINLPGTAPTWMTCAYLQNMLQYSLKNDSIRVQDFDIIPGSSVGDNYSGQIFRIKCHCTIQRKQDTKSIIGKAVPTARSTDELARGMELFNTEIRMFSETLPLLYEELSSKMEADPFSPFFYNADIENKIFFLEDLQSDGYVLANRKQSLDLDHVLLVIKSLAKLHATSYLIFNKNPDYKMKYWNYFFKRQEDNFFKRMMEGRRGIFLKALDKWPISEDDKEIFRKFDFYELLLKSYERKESSFNALNHGDCWTNNVMFKYEDGNLKSVKIFDFQLSNYNSIGLDLNYFLFTSAKEYVKLSHQEDVFQTYYDTFVSVAGEIEGFTVDTIRREFIERLGFGFSAELMFRPEMISDTPFDTKAFFENRKSESNDRMYRGAEYVSEVVKLLPLFKKYEVFK